MNVPNLISLARLLSVPLTVWFILVDELMAAFLLFVIAGVSDAVDGYIAKKYGATSELGAYLDPLADKALLVGIYVTLGLQNELPVWLVILVVFRDLLIIGGALLLQFMTPPVRMAPHKISKANTAAQITLASVVLGQLALQVPMATVVTALIVVVALTTVLSGANYLVEWTRLVANFEGGK